MAATPQEKKKFMTKGMEQVDEGLPGWFGTFADMMTLLFAFFVLLAAISTIDPVKLQNMADSVGKSVGTKEEMDNQAMSLGDIHKAAVKMIEEMAEGSEDGDETPVEVTTSPKGVTIGISSDISFESGSATTKPGFLEILEKIVPTIQESYFMIAVEGHTDSDPLPKSLRAKFPSNWELSGARAAAVVTFSLESIVMAVALPPSTILGVLDNSIGVFVNAIIYFSVLFMLWKQLR